RSVCVSIQDVADAIPLGDTDRQYAAGGYPVDETQIGTVHPKHRQIVTPWIDDIQEATVLTQCQGSLVVQPMTDARATRRYGRNVYECSVRGPPVCDHGIFSFGVGHCKSQSHEGRWLILRGRRSTAGTARGAQECQRNGTDQSKSFHIVRALRWR